MKKLFILAVSMTLAMSAATAQTTPAATKSASSKKATTAGPVITFAEKSHDFGKINQGDVVEYTFKFKNTGNQPLVLSNVSATCGCTVPEWPKEPIAPGKSGSIKATFNSAGKLGQQNKVITVESNATNSPAQVSIITDIQEKSAGSSMVKPAAAPAVNKK
jgi:hypothetical protein